MIPLSVELRLGRRYAINWSAPVIPLEFHPAERVGLGSGRIRRLIKKAFHIFSLGKESRKFYREFNVELHGTDDDRELIARYNARCEESGLAEYDRSVSRLREADREA